MATQLPHYGPLPQPASLEEAVEVLGREKFPAPDVCLVEFTATEFTSLCPRTGQPDFGKVIIQYLPREYCIESKSLKFYLWAFRNEGAFCETLTSKIADDVVSAIDPLWTRVTVTQNTRGGIALKSSAVRAAPGYSNMNCPGVFTDASQ
ncbi:MAG: preQ(1) synthase [Dehalococcoidales bacterium]|nr:preQ(1) synthase [Dehalococcoidales bacterium]